MEREATIRIDGVLAAARHQVADAFGNDRVFWKAMLYGVPAGFCGFALGWVGVAVINWTVSMAVAGAP